MLNKMKYTYIYTHGPWRKQQAGNIHVCKNEKKNFEKIQISSF